MKNVRIDLKKTIDKINDLLKKIDEEEWVTESDDVPMALNVLKLLEIYHDKGNRNFYGTVSIKMIGFKCRNIKITERSFKLCEEKEDYLQT